MLIHRKPIFPVLLIIVLGILAYSNTFSVPFLFDDVANIVENPAVKDLRYFIEPSRAKEFTPSGFLTRRYIGYLSFAINYRLHGLDLAGYHIVNLSIHIINSLLVYWLVLLTFRTPVFPEPHTGRKTRLIAVFSALLFVSHPIQTQAVTYIVQRFASLATLFYLLSLVSYIQWRLKTQSIEDRQQTTDSRQSALNLKSVFWYPVSVISAVLAMKTKEIAFTLPLIIIMYEFVFFRGGMKRRMLFLIPILLTMLIVPLTLTSTGKPLSDILNDAREAKTHHASLSRGDYLLTQFRVIVTYLRLLFFPVGQNFDYDYPAYHSFFDPAVLPAFLFLISLGGGGGYLFHRSRFAPYSSLRLATFGIFWFIITLAVESSVIPITDIIFEHRVYLPSVGALIAITTGVYAFVERPGAPPYMKKAVNPLLSLAVIVLSLATFARNGVWRDGLAFWNDVVGKSPGKARGYVNRGAFLIERGSLDQAIDDLEKAIRLDPTDAVGYNNLGDALYKKGQKSAAWDCLSQAVKRDPFYYRSYYNMGIISGNSGDHGKAVFYFTNTLKLRTDFAQAYTKRGIGYLNIGNNIEAASDFRKACDMGDEEGCRALDLLRGR